RGHVIVTALVQLRELDGGGNGNRLHAARQHMALPPPPEYYSVQKSSRPVNELVALPLGAGLDPSAVQRAVKTLDRRLEKTGVRGLIMGRQSRLYVARSRGQMRRLKRLASAKRRRRSARLAARRERLADLRGL